MFTYAYWLLIVFLIAVHAVGYLTVIAGIVAILVSDKPTIPGVFSWLLFGLFILAVSAYALAFVFSKGP